MPCERGQTKDSANRRHLRNRRIIPLSSSLPLFSHEAPVACPPWIYTNRNLVERFWSRVKEWRAVATRYEKTERSFMGVLCMAATMDWLKA